MYNIIEEVYALLSYVQKPQLISREAVTQMLKRWAEQKAWLLPQFGADHRIVVPIDATAQYQQRANTAISWHEVQRMVKEADDELLPSEIQFIAYVLHYLCAQVTIGELATNTSTSTHTYNTYRMVSDRQFQILIPQGVKLGKALAGALKTQADQWMGRLDEAKRDWIINQITVVLSRLTQKVQGRTQATLVISAHPVDLLMMAMSTAGAWTSCMNIADSRTGYNRIAATGWLTDANTVIAYAYERTQKIADLPYDYPVKIWRELAHIGITEKAIHWPNEKPSANIVFSNTMQTKLVEVVAAAWECSINGTYATVPYPTCIHPAMYADHGTKGFYFGQLPTSIRITDVLFHCLNCGKPRLDVAKYSETNRNFVCEDCMKQSSIQQSA